MNLVLLTIAFSIFVFGALVGNKDAFFKSQQNNTLKSAVSEEVLSDEDRDMDEDETEEEDEGSFSGSERDNLPTVKPFPALVTITPPKPTVQVTEGQISQFIYPGSSVVEKTSTKLTLSSPDDPKKISDWYKTEIKKMNFSATSSVFTQASEKYLVKISASDGSSDITVEITKEGNGSAAINISLD